MIQANELRLNNWVMIGDNYNLVRGIHIQANYFTGIPITTELLLEKCGFEKTYNNDWVQYQMPFDRSMGIGFNADGFICMYYDFDCDYVLPSCGESLVVPLKHIKYLHQLQNLIYSISSEELTVKM